VFTGLVQAVGRVRAIEERTQGRRLAIEVGASELREADRAIGASVCVDGVCLTVIENDARGFAVDVAFETLRVTTLGRVAVGSRVNLEPSLRVGDPLGGHLVSGHVDGLARLLTREARGEACEMWFEIPQPLARFVAVKGSICLGGVSLTLNAVEGTRFMVGLVPHTLRATTLDALGPGDELNVEIDTVARYVERLLSTRDRT
jgi:riboflavin synthase